MTLDQGPLAYKSRYAPIPLTPEEEALLVFAACGVTGCALADLAYNHDGGGNIMSGLAGRTISSGDAIQTVSLITINDSGAYLYRRPRDMSFQTVTELLQSVDKSDFVGAAEKMRVRIANKRVRISSAPIFNINANRWSAHAAGTSCFLPVNELTFMYINGLLEIFNEHTGVFVLDERASFRPAGVGKFARSKGGHLNDDPKDGKIATVAVVERLVTEFVTIEQGMMHQNLALMTQALGLGGYPSFANHDFAWCEALEFRLERMRSSQYLGIRGIMAAAMRWLGKDIDLPIPVGLEREGEPLLKCYAPPYYPNMQAAVQAVVAEKRSVFGAPGNHRPWKDNGVAAQIVGPTEKAIAATTAYCDYVWKRYGRFPALMPPFRTVLSFQAGHLDLEFYDRFYSPGAVSETQLELDKKLQKQKLG